MGPSHATNGHDYEQRRNCNRPRNVPSAYSSSNQRIDEIGEKQGDEHRSKDPTQLMPEPDQKDSQSDPEELAHGRDIPQMAFRSGFAGVVALWSHMFPAVEGHACQRRLTVPRSHGSVE
jgi:hypothetical protein